MESLRPHSAPGDIILDASNEHYHNTERRQKILDPLGIYLVGMGVSGGYQSARHGPSMSPNSKREAVESVLPLLRKVAAKDAQGRPCVAWMEGGSDVFEAWDTRSELVSSTF